MPRNVNSSLEQLVREAIDVTGAPTPALLADNAPVLEGTAIADDDDSGFYLVGLIGGKDVGKSALVNALVGAQITAVTSHGAGTEIAIAYAHASQVAPLREMLERATPGSYRIVPHELDRLRRQVLVDLPDIDSRYETHPEVTRAMLRHLLFPVWVSSIEKYADIQPQQMLARVAEGNSPENFIFVLNKVDQLSEGPRLQSPRASIDCGAAAAQATGLTPREELRQDYAQRLARTLKLAQTPRVYMIAARHPDRYELPALREVLSRQKSAEVVRESKQAAAARQDRALLSWLEGQDLVLRAQRLAQLEADARNLIDDRLAQPLLQRVVPRLLEDPATRMAMTDDILQDRVAHWPILNLVHTLVQPLFVLLRSAVARSAAPLLGPDAMVDAVIRESGESVAKLVQSAFANLRQTQPAVASLYPHAKPWEDAPAEAAAAGLHRSLCDAVQRQRAAVRDVLSSRHAPVGATARWIITIGALIWFPFLQPILSRLLPHEGQTFIGGGGRLIGLIVDVLGVDYLLKSAGFLAIYYLVLWLALRWNTQRKIAQLVRRWRVAEAGGAAAPDAAFNLALRTRRWIDELMRPITDARERMQSLAERAAALKSQAAAA